MTDGVAFVVVGVEGGVVDVSLLPIVPGSEVVFESELPAAAITPMPRRTPPPSADAPICSFR